ncbi:OmpP1/FadL family transporter [Ectothiorhodospira shaposhnikovii]|uniref:OmpP1/FadL family transporter n=1 Tax=Ectothiorhodospira shaposhnikovii TaxID=1054 RepID=UPI0039A2B2A5
MRNDSSDGRFTRRRAWQAALPGALLMSALSGGAQGAAFALKEQSAAALGNAFAGATAGAEDISYSFFNPAALAYGTGTEISLVGSLILPQFEYASDNPTAGLPYPGAHHSKSDQGAFVPAAFVARDLGEGLRLGLSVTVPYGLETDYVRRWVGRYDAINTDLLTVDINPALAWRVSPRLALGIGLSAQYADASLSSAVPGAGITPDTDGKIQVEGDDWTYGFNLGLLYEPVAGTRLGLAYRSRISHELSGHARYTPAGLGPVTADPQKVGGTAKLELPETVGLGLHQDIGPRWSVMADATWTRWSRFDELRIRFADDIALATDPVTGLPISAISESVDEYSWQDTWFLAVGASYRVNERWTLRGGLAHDESPVSTCCRTPRIPDDDRTWVTVGATFQPSDRTRLDLGYAYIRLKDADIVLNGESALPEISGGYESSVQILTASFNHRF